MGKAIGVFTGTTLVAATLWLAASGRPARDVRAAVEPGNQQVETRDTAQRELTARDLLARGLEEFRKGRYANAARTLESAGFAPGELTPAEQRELQDYLGNARTAMQKAAAPSPYGDRYKAVARQHLNDARRAANRGDAETARDLATRAAGFPVTWEAGEESPDDFLASLDQYGRRPSRNEVAAGAAASPFAPEAAQPRQTSSRTSENNPFANPPAGQRTAAQPAASPSDSDSLFGPVAGKGDSQAASSQSDAFAADTRSASRGPEAPYEGGMTAAASGAARRLRAEMLLEQSRTALESGRYEEARQKADEAAGLNVAWGLFDERPEHLLSEVTRRTGETRFDRGAMLADSQPAAGPKPASRNTAQGVSTDGSTGSAKEQARQLLTEARQAMEAGRFEEAHQKASAASRIDVAYGLFEETPQVVLDDLARHAAETANIAAAERSKPAAGNGNANGNGNPPMTVASESTRRAQGLLSEARELLRSGKPAAARQKVEEAEQLGAVYGVFDDRPALVMREIERSQNEGSLQPANIAAAGGIPAAGQLAAGVRPVADTREQATEERETAADSMAARREQARVLVSRARLALQENRPEEARQLAEQAEKLNVPFGVFDDRPDHVLADLARQQNLNSNGPGPRTVADNTPAIRNQPAAPRLPMEQPVTAAFSPEPTESRTPVREQPPVTASPVPAAAVVQAGAEETPSTSVVEDLAVVHPTGVSADELYQQGLQYLSQGNRHGAYQAFLRAYESGQRMNPHREQQMQDLLRDLAPRRDRGIQLTSGEVASPPSPRNAEPDRIGVAEQQESIRFDRLRTETMNAVFRAERLKEKNPSGALEIIDRTLATVENSELSEELVSPMVRRLQKSRTSIETLQSQRAPIVELEARNKEIRSEIERERQLSLRIDQEIADQVDEYNRLFKQKRYADCEVIARQIKELDAENPIGETLFWKARFGRRVSRNEELQLTKEDATWEAWDEVERAAIPHHGAPMQFPKNWAEISSRRNGRYGPDNRTRTEEEKRIEKSLSRQISLHFQEIPLRDVMKHVATVADVNVVLDNLGLEDEGVTTDTPVSIDVNGIRLKSALNLLLEPLHLAYTIEDEVLKVTSRMRQQGRLVVATYPVADLVVPIPNFTPSGSTGMSSGGLGLQNTGLGGGNMSVPSGGGFQQAAGAQFQVADPLAGGGGPWNGVAPGLDAQMGRGGSAVDFDTITDLIVATVEPDSWNEVGGPGSVRSFETTLSLVIRQTQKVHEEIADLLEQLRRLQDLQVTIEVRFVTVTDRFFERIGIDFDFDVNDNVEGDSTAGVPFGSQGGAGLTGVTGDDDDDDDATGQNFFDPPTGLNLPELDDWPKGGTIVGLQAPDTFTTDLDVGFRQGSFDIGVPDFGNFNPDAGIQFGMAILSDIEAFFFVQAAQGDERSNLMFAPKVTLFNGQQATVQSTVQRPFVTSLIPTVGFFSVGFTPQITVLSEGVTMSVQAVISADRRFVRLTVIPSFTNITDVFTFTFQSNGQGQQGAQGQGQGGNTGNNNPFGAGGNQGQGQFDVPDVNVPLGFSGNTMANGPSQFSVRDTINPTMGFGGIGGGMLLRNLLAPTLTEQVQGQGQQGQQQQGQQNQQGNNLGVGNITIQQPVFEVVNVTTTVSVPDGGTVLLGGIKRLREGRNMAGVPILNKLPYVSRLFKNTGVGRETESLMMMVTPRIIIQEEEEELLGIPL